MAMPLPDSDTMFPGRPITAQESYLPNIMESRKCVPLTDSEMGRAVQSMLNVGFSFETIATATGRLASELKTYYDVWKDTCKES